MLSHSGKLGDPEVCSSVPPSSVRRIRLSVMWRTVQAIQLSPYRSGVAGPPHTRLLRFPAFQPCACPLALSGPGQAVASESSALNSGLLWRQFTPCVTWRTVSVHPAPQLLFLCHTYLVNQSLWLFSYRDNVDATVASCLSHPSLHPFWAGCDRLPSCPHP